MSQESMHFLNDKANNENCIFHEEQILIRIKSYAFSKQYAEESIKRTKKPFSGKKCQKRVNSLVKIALKERKKNRYRFIQMQDGCHEADQPFQKSNGVSFRNQDYYFYKILDFEHQLSSKLKLTVYSTPSKSYLQKNICCLENST